MNVWGTETRRRALCALLALLCLLTLPSAARAETLTIEQPLLENLLLSVDGAESVTVRTLHYSYENNRYVSLRDVAAALAETPRRFSLTIGDAGVVIATGGEYRSAGGEGKPFPETGSDGAPYVYATQPLAPNPMEIDGRQLRYLSFYGLNASSKPDCFMSLTDLAMQLDLCVSVSDGRMAADTAGGYTADLLKLRDEGFYYEVHSALVGDVTTGEIYAAWEPDLSVPIASTTKLMSFIIVMDAVTDGQISLSDTVTVTEEAARLSHTEDGTISMQTGMQTTVTELLCGMLLPSSNECALALAIHTAGSEAAFVARMNRKAQLLGLSDGAVFYNCHGLPIYTDNLPATKVQNRMSAADMFTLVGHLMRSYPEVTRITSLKSAALEGLNATVANTNPLLYNLPGAVGLKTGTTNMSGACLVGAAEAEGPDGRTHTLVSVEYGAEDSASRTTFSEELLRYAMQRLAAGSTPTPAPELPTDAEALIRMILAGF